MKKILYIAFIVYFIGSVSCSDFLEPKSTTEFTPKDVESMNELILGTAYPGASKSESYWGLIKYLDDDVTTRPYVEALTTSGTSAYDDMSIQGAKVLYSWTPDYDIKLKELLGGRENIDTYSALYGYIIGANAVLDYIDNMIGTENEKRNVKAQALALRAFHYFHLTNVYGTPYNSHPDGLGVPLKLTSKIEERPLVRNTVAECYNQILDDFLAAENYYEEMGDDHQWKPNYRPSLAMVRLMLSRVYLYMENWKEAARYAKLVMDDSNFSLHDLNDSNKFPVPTPSSSKEEYVNFIAYETTSFSMPETIWLYGEAAQSQSYRPIDTKPGSTNVKDRTSLFNASDELLDAYNEKVENVDEDDPDKAASDLRRALYIVAERYNYNTERLKRAYGKISVGTFSSGRPPVSTDKKTGKTAYGRALRLSEAYLNYAEAMAMMAKEGGAGDAQSEALKTLNELREKRIKKSKFVAVTAADFSSADELVTFVRNERRRELCFEGHRWFDLRRYGMPTIKHVWRGLPGIEEEITLDAGSHFYAIPILKSVLDQNTALVADPWK